MGERYCLESYFCACKFCNEVVEGIDIMQMGTSISRARQRHAELDVRKAKQRYAKLGRETPSYAELRRATQSYAELRRATQSYAELRRDAPIYLEIRRAIQRLFRQKSCALTPLTTGHIASRTIKKCDILIIFKLCYPPIQGGHYKSMAWANAWQDNDRKLYLWSHLSRPH